MEKIIAFCGINCTECEAFIATQKNDQAELARIAKKWSNEHIKFTTDDLICKGCISTDKVFEWCSNCNIRNCGIEKGHKNCAYCDSFENCDNLKGIHEHSPIAQENLLEIRKTL